LDKLILFRLFHLFIPLVIADNGQLRFLGLTPQRGNAAKIKQRRAINTIV